MNREPGAAAGRTGRSHLTIAACPAPLNEIGNGPLSLREDVPIALLRHSPLFSDLHVLVGGIAARGTVPATSAGYLDPAFGDTLLGQFTWPGEEADEVRRGIPEIDHENEFRPLQELRARAHALDLIELSGGAFRLTDRGHDLVRPERAGVLYQRLVTHLLGRRGWDWEFDPPPPAPPRLGSDEGMGR